MKPRDIAIGLLACAALAACAKPGGGKVVDVYNWNDYIAPDANPNFEHATGIHVVYDNFDRNEVLETKLLAGSSGYDVVVPSSQFLGRQLKAGVFLPLDKAKIPNYSHLDPDFMRKLEALDPGNRYGIPYMWGTVGIGYNVDAIKRIFGNVDVANSLDILFKAENAAKLNDCGINILDTPSEIVPVVLNYLHEDPNSHDPATIAKAQALLAKIRPYVRSFHSSSYIDGLAGGDVCLALGWSGDVIQARNRANEANNGVHVAYAIPREGSAMWIDMLAIPQGAAHVDAAYAYINYLLDPKVMAANSDFIAYPNAIPAAKALMRPEIVDDPTIYPPADVAARLFTFSIVPPDVDRQYETLWTELKSGK